jgi:hypothetical protein
MSFRWAGSAAWRASRLLKNSLFEAGPFPHKFFIMA